MLFSIFITIPTIVSYSQDVDEIISDNPPWILYKRGLFEYRNREFGTALRYFRGALRKKSPYPEAEYGIGLIFQEEGEYELAIKQYKKALEHKGKLYISSLEYDILGQLAQVYGLGEKYNRYEETLNKIIDRNAYFSEHANSNLLNRYKSILSEEGLNKLLILYRIEEKYPSSSVSQLGIFYYRTGRYNAAAEYLCTSVITNLTEIIQELMVLDPEFEFETVKEVLNRSQGKYKITRYIEESGFFMNLYYLANSMYALQELESAKNLWQIVRNYNDGTWGRRAENQIRSPIMEPLLDEYK